jgi:glutamate-5-semialdehyde dehydrogenase
VNPELSQHATSLARAARTAGLALAVAPHDARSVAIRGIARGIRGDAEAILEANARDVAEARVAPAVLERLKLTPARVNQMADAVDRIAEQPDPIGQTIESRIRRDGLRIEKRRVPLGSVLFIYESRPNVTTDAAALCIKSGNAVILRGGKEALNCNRVLGRIIRSAVDDASLPGGAVQVVESIDRALLPLLLRQEKFIDLVIPRGGEGLIRAVVDESRIPVLKHFTGNCHIYVDSSAHGLMPEKVIDVIVNAKTSYPGGAVCNAVEHVLFHREAMDMLPLACAALAAKGVEIRGDERVADFFPQAKPATRDDWEAEYLSFIIGIKVVDSLDEAIDHINEHGSHHTDAILASSPQAIEQFVARVDSASVMVNASTRLADGGEFGLGAEIGISTDKLHARGPMGAADLTTYKWIVTGDGHLRT